MFFGKKEDPPAGTITSLPLLPLRDVVVFPHMVVPLFVGRDRSIKALESAMKSDGRIFLASQKSAQQTAPKEQDIFMVGTIGQIVQMLKLPDATIKVFVEGRQRARIVLYTEDEDFYRVEVEPISDRMTEREVEIQAAVRGIKAVFENYLAIGKKLPQEFVTSIRQMTDASSLADALAGQLNLTIESKQHLLECASPKERIDHLMEFMQSEIEISEIEKKIRERVKKQMEEPEGVLPQRADARNSEGDGRKGRLPKRNRRTRRAVGQQESAAARRCQGQEGDPQAQIHVPYVRGSYRGPQLHRLVPGSPVVRGFRERADNRRRAKDPRRGSLRPD